MTIEETAKLITYISSLWTRAWQGVKGGEASVVKAWADLLEDVPAGAALAAVRAHASTSEWPPTISDIRRAALVSTDIPDWSKSYQTIMYAVRKYGSYESVDGLESLDTVSRTIAERIGWRELCQSEEGDAAIRAHVMKIHQGLQDRGTREALIPGKVMEQLRRLTGGTKVLPEGGAKDVDGE